MSCFKQLSKHINTSCADLDYWLSRDHDFRKNQINLWLELIKPIENSIFFCLDHYSGKALKLLK